MGIAGNAWACDQLFSKVMGGMQKEEKDEQEETRDEEGKKGVVGWGGASSEGNLALVAQFPPWERKMTTELKISMIVCGWNSGSNGGNALKTLNLPAQ